MSGLLRSMFFVGVIALTGLALVACSGSGSSAQAPDAPIGIQSSQLSVVIENKAGMPLLNVAVAILPVGGMTEFTKVVARMENAEKREFALSDFYGRDGTTFSLRVVRPKTVRVTAKDLTDKAYKVERPWQ
jgi:hypothetical protein